jgi:hypothetical protein
MPTVRVRGIEISTETVRELQISTETVPPMPTVL